MPNGTGYTGIADRADELRTLQDHHDKDTKVINTLEAAANVLHKELADAVDRLEAAGVAFDGLIGMWRDPDDLTAEAREHIEKHWAMLRDAVRPRALTGEGSDAQLIGVCDVHPFHHPPWNNCLNWVEGTPAMQTPAEHGELSGDVTCGYDPEPHPPNEGHICSKWCTECGQGWRHAKGCSKAAPSGNQRGEEWRGYWCTCGVPFAGDCPRHDRFPDAPHTPKEPAPGGA